MNRSAKRKKLDDSDAFCSEGVVDVTLVLRRRTTCLYVTRYAIIVYNNHIFLVEIKIMILNLCYI